MQRRTITKLLRKNYSAEKKRLLILAWANDWENEQTELIRRLGAAVNKNDFDELCICVGQLKEVSSKKFAALTNSLTALLDKKSMQDSLNWSQNNQDLSDAKALAEKK